MILSFFQVFFALFFFLFSELLVRIYEFFRDDFLSLSSSLTLVTLSRSNLLV